MKIAPLAQIKNQLSAYVEACKDSPVVITKNGKAVAVIMPISDEDDLDTLLLVNNPRFIGLLEEARERVRRQDGVKSDDFWAELKRRRDTKPPIGKGGKPRATRTIRARNNVRAKTPA